MNGFHFNLVDIPSYEILRGQILYVIVNYVVSFILNVQTKKVSCWYSVRLSYVVSVLKSDFVGRAAVKSAKLSQTHSQGLCDGM